MKEMSIIPANARFVLSAPGIARWAAVRFVVYLAAAATTAFVFVAGAAFYSFVWPAPSIVQAPSPTIPDRLPPTVRPAFNPDEEMKNIFSPNAVRPALVSELSLNQLGNALVISLDDRKQQDFGNVFGVRPLPLPGGRDFVLEISKRPGTMSNEFGLRTPYKVTMRASDLRWYLVQKPAAPEIYAVATNEQLRAAMNREILTQAPR